MEPIYCVLSMHIVLPAYSAHVDRADVLEAKRLAGDYSKGLVRALEKEIGRASCRERVFRAV